MKLSMIGYEKRDIVDFIDILLNDGIETLVDIRAVPYSRNKDYTKRNLEKKLDENGIGYILLKELGSPLDLRRKVKTDGDYRYFFEKYNKFLDGKKDSLRGLIKIAREKRICLLCYEADPNRCHRSAVANKMVEFDDGFEIVHL